MDHAPDDGGDLRHHVDAQPGLLDLAAVADAPAEVPA
jgi:hypothetical protein